MIATYRLAFFAFKRVWALMLTSALMLSAIDIYFDNATSTFGVIMITYGVLALAAHRAILLDEKADWAGRKQNQSWFPFLGRYLLFFLVPALVWGLSLLMLFQAVDMQTDANALGVVLISMLPATLAFLIFTSIFGAMLPAAAVGTDASLRTALKHKRILRTLWRLFSGNLLFWVLGTAAGLYAAIHLPETQIMTFVLKFLMNMVGLFAVLLTASALSLAYMETEGVIPKQP